MTSIQGAVGEQGGVPAAWLLYVLMNRVTVEQRGLVESLDGAQSTELDV